ncbi:Acyl-CoA N-acyltransferase [Metarhizium album ARSEF 1941]|uniref:Acyl-CoA N-acyltransferase n=1 Tax=Metarhizium album (strain ARSEF 1941) TaxID=1081103 RepID=A0A0B2WV06_METAS|nr:Acyl-CoA N-acyltransferase [Metarhizium album ARSEF 1941]KHN97484.1 Acyl-CoA N-acyltransferase [Metarhizium album ARSEF 1941]
MTIRQAKYSDLRAMAETAAAAFHHDELFGELMHPRRQEYPQDFINYFERRFLKKWGDPGCRFLVGLDKTSDKVIAVAQWERQGVRPASWSNSLIAGPFMQSASWLYLSALDFLWPNRAADPDKIRILEETYPLFAHHWIESRRQNWFLDVLATHPDHQGQGLGKKLVMWGVNKAMEEGICASVISSYGNEAFYGQYGFIEVGRANIGRLGACGIKGGAIMFCEEHVSRRACVGQK